MHGTGSLSEDPGSRDRSDTAASGPAVPMASDAIRPVDEVEHGKSQLDSVQERSARSIGSHGSQLSMGSERQDIVGELRPKASQSPLLRRPEPLSLSHLKGELPGFSLTQQCSAVIHSFVSAGFDFVDGPAGEAAASLDATTAPGLPAPEPGSPAKTKDPAESTMCPFMRTSQLSKLLRQVSHLTLSPGLKHRLICCRRHTLPKLCTQTTPFLTKTAGLWRPCHAAHDG